MKSKFTTFAAMVLAAVCLLALPLLAGCEKGPNPNDPANKQPKEQMEATDHAAKGSESSASAASSDAAGDDGAEDESSSAAASSGPVMLQDFNVLSQYPELPNGCEVTTLAAVLNYMGAPASKTVLSDTFLPKAPVGQANFYREFVGNPRESDAYGCYAPVIVDTAESYLASTGSNLTVADMTGTPFTNLFPYIDRGIPVIVWATQYNQTGHHSVTWNVGGQALTWFTPEHCMALIGYDEDAGLVYVADPMEGDVASYDMATFISNYNDLGQQAIVIQ